MRGRVVIRRLGAVSEKLRRYVASIFRAEIDAYEEIFFRVVLSKWRLEKKYLGKVVVT